MSASSKINDSPGHFMVLLALVKGLDTEDKISKAIRKSKEEVRAIINDLVNQRKAIEDFREDKHDILGKLNASKIPILVLMGDHDICFQVEDWYHLVGKLPSIQLIVMPQAGHAVQHQYPDLAANYITAFINNSLA